MLDDFIFRGSFEELDPDLSDLLAREDQRQAATIILVASESASPAAVQAVMGSNFGNIYAEGYPRESSRRQTEAEILDFERELALYRRHSDPRYYKGVEYADILEALTRRRAAELFAANGVTADNLCVNVQPLSGAPANNAVYTALLQPGDTIMGLNLNDGGHLSHGSRVNRSGIVYNAVPYYVDPDTEALDYDAVERQVLEARPQIIVAGYSAYPLIVDWARFRAMADKVGAYLLADIAHISGLVAAGVHPSPIGIADVVTTTTHKSLCGPRGAMILTHRKDLAATIDKAVFPGEQGGPHLNTIAALALALKLAQSEPFRALQQRIVANAARLAQKLTAHGLRIVAGRSENHLLMIDGNSVSHDGVTLSGDMAARILDVAGIVTNRNTIPGDRSAFSASGIRIGTVWISQLGYGPAEIDQLAEAIAITLKGCTPFTYEDSGRRTLKRAKVDWNALQQARAIVRQLTGAAEPEGGNGLIITGDEATAFLDYATTSDVAALGEGEAQRTRLHLPDGTTVAATLERAAANQYFLYPDDAAQTAVTAVWLRDLSDGYVQFGDLWAKLPGPVVIQPMQVEDPVPDAAGEPVAATKPYFIGCEQYDAGPARPAFSWQEPADAPLRRTNLYDTHVTMGARIVPFGGWEMPVWYTSVSEEHQAVRQAAGLFDVSHMGVLEASGPHALAFLNAVVANDVATLSVGESQYTHLLLPDGAVIDDLLIYRRGPERYMLVVNAANNDKDWAWLNAVNDGAVQIDLDRPGARIQHPAVLRDLRDPQHGDDCRVDLALQGPAATKILLALCDDRALAARIKALPWAGLVEGKVGGFELIISRTGYTGERTAYELFAHPERAPELWEALLAAGEPFGLKPCGLAARDSTRTEAGLPLYGHELAGPLALDPGQAGFGSFVKLWTPFFVGRRAYIARDQARQGQVVRFRMNETGVRRAELGDPVLDRRGKVIGTVTSCAIDSEGYLLGQAYVLDEFARRDAAVQIYQMGGGQRPLRLPGEVKIGARMPAPDAATVLTRFPSRRK